MDESLLPYYQVKKIIDYCGYQIAVYQNKTSLPNISKFVISIFIDKKKIGEVETDNDADGINKIKSHIDRSEADGSKLVFFKP